MLNKSESEFEQGGLLQRERQRKCNLKPGLASSLSSLDTWPCPQSAAQKSLLIASSLQMHIQQQRPVCIPSSVNKQNQSNPTTKEPEHICRGISRSAVEPRLDALPVESWTCMIQRQKAASRFVNLTKSLLEIHHKIRLQTISGSITGIEFNMLVARYESRCTSPRSIGRWLWQQKYGLIQLQPTLQGLKPFGGLESGLTLSSVPSQNGFPKSWALPVFHHILPETESVHRCYVVCIPLNNYCR